MTILTRADNVSVSDMEGDLFLVHPETGEIWHLDPMAAAIWNAAGEPVSRTDLLDLFVTAFPDQAEEKLRQDLSSSLEPLVAARLLIETGPDSS